MQTSHLRTTYENYPYPAADETALSRKRWNIAPMEWIRALWKPGDPRFAPPRILVAGCGTGSEAFALRRKFPRARIVAFDLSPRSIAIAKNLQKRVRAMRNIRFFVADLADRNLAQTTGGNFDFISCHGVLSYVPAPRPVLANLARCLKADGALYLGVNGTEHFSVRGRKFLPAMGLDIRRLPNLSSLRPVLQLWDAINDGTDSIRMAKFSPGYLAGDLFGRVMHNLPLTDWLKLARPAGLHFQGSYSCWRTLRLAMGKEFRRILFPRSRSEVCRLLELIAPATFHRLLFMRQAEGNPNWQNPDDLRESYPLATRLYSIRLPERGSARRPMRRVVCKSAALNTRLDCKMPEWEIETLRQSDGRHRLGDILAQSPFPVPERQLREQMYILHQLLVLTVRPEKRRRA